MQDVARGIGLDNRIGGKFLHAGPGYGGSCFPKDTLALVKTGQDADAPMRIVETVVAVNDQRKRGMAKKVIAACGGSVQRQDDRRAGPDLQAQHRRHARRAFACARAQPWRMLGARLRVYDPGRDAAGQAEPAASRVLRRRL